VIHLNKIFSNLKDIFPGIFLISILSLIAIFFSQYILIGTVSIVIILGILVGNLVRIPNSFQPGILFGEKKVLNFAIILMGANLNFNLLSMINWNYVLFILSLVFSSIIISFLLGKVFKLSSGLSLLIGVGNGICGSSAIAAVSNILKSKKEDIGISMTVINMVGVLGVFLVPSIIYFLQIDSIFIKGFIAGGTIQAVGQVTAAGFMINNQVGEIAIFVKMLRILFLGPVMIIIAGLFFLKKSKSTQDFSFRFPYFILGFIFVMFACNTGLVSKPVIYLMNQLSDYLLLLAMVSIGLNISFKTIFSDGYKIFSLTLLSFLVQFSFIIIFIKYIS